MALYGTSPGAVLVPSANVFLTNVPGVTAADGALVTNGSTTDAVCSLPTSVTACTIEGVLKASANALNTIAGSIMPSGNTAPGTDPGAGIVVLGKYNTSPPAPTNGQTLALQTDSAGNLKTSSAGAQSNASDAVATSSTSSAAVVWNYIFNGTTWDRMQGDAAKNLKVNLAANALDACANNVKTTFPISQATSTQLFAGTSAKTTYICSIVLNGSDAENISLVEGTGTVCATSIAAVIGGTTAAAGMNLAANSGFGLGNGGYTIASASAVAADNICLLQSGSGRVAGVLTYVKQ
jgi:hypothetical protein